MTNSSPHFSQDPEPEKAAGFPVCAAMDAWDLKPGIEAVARYFGGSRYRADIQTRERIRAAIEKACRMASPRMTVAIRPILPPVLNETLTLAGGQSLPLPDGTADSPARFLASAIGTLGRELETECRHLAAKRHIYRSTLLDAVGTAMLDAMDTKIRARIDAKARSMGLCSKARFAPGLNGYPMDHQQTLFQMARGHSIDVRINADFMMEPVKTISFFTLLGIPDKESSRPDKCRLCRLTHCQFRKAAPAEKQGDGSWPGKC